MRTGTDRVLTTHTGSLPRPASGDVADVVAGRLAAGVPGVIDSTRNYVEHPELAAQRIRRFTGRVGTARVLAGSDCGFATFGARPSVHPEITWAKLAVLAEGAARA